MEFTTLDVRTSDDLSLKVGVYADGGAGPSILVLHGLYSHMGWYRRLGEALAAQGAGVFLLDRRGAGLSEGVAGHMGSWRQVVDDIQRVVTRIRAVRPGSAVCALGISLGATMTLATSLVARDCFARQALLSPGLAPAMQIPLRRRVGVAYSAFRRPRVLYELPFTVEQLCEHEGIRAALWSDPLRTRSVTSRFLLETFRLQRFVRANIGRLRTPVLALLAGEDAMVDNAAAVQILGHTHGTPVRIEIFEGAGHVLPASVPEAELVGRIGHWLSMPESAFERRVVIETVPPFPAEACA